MRILLAHNSLYYPSHGGGDKSNRLLMEALAALGHEVRVVSRIEKFGPEGHERILQKLEERGVDPQITADSVAFRLNGVLVYTLTRSPQLRAFFATQLAAFDPDVIITSTDDPGQLLFDLARRAPRARLVYLVRATIAVPFGPDSSMVSAVKTEALRDADGVVGVSEHVAAYAREYGGVDAVHLPISLMDQGEPGVLGRFENPYVVMVNPCAVKGIAIFLALAERMPHLTFAGVPMWGTTAEDLAALRRHANIVLIEPVDNIDQLFRQARVALVPSVWAEARSRVVMEAMLRGVPVIASDAGGLREAKMGVPYLIPVQHVTHYQHTVDENMVPVADVPKQDIGPWQVALDRLTSDRQHWEDISAQSRQAALNYLKTLTAESFEAFLKGLLAQPKLAAPHAPAADPLSENKRRLVEVRMRQRLAQKSESIWVPALERAREGRLRLFCFPHAGGGTLAYRPWLGALPGVSVLPVALPGRERRSSEPPLEDMPTLVAALMDAIGPFLTTPYAFFGHSMGAGIAFELTRALRRAGSPLPNALIVSSARAPQLRSRQQPADPSSEELFADLARVNGQPPEILLQIPSLLTDARLYRRYFYTPEPPLHVPIFAYGGTEDRAMTHDHLAAWRDQTTASFTLREFPGDHFYLQSNPAAVVEALRQDLQAGVTGASKSSSDT